MNGFAERDIRTVSVRAWLLPMFLVIVAPWAGLGCGGASESSSGSTSGAVPQSLAESEPQSTPAITSTENHPSLTSAEPFTNPSPSDPTNAPPSIPTTALRETGSEANAPMSGGGVILPDPDSDTVGFEGPALGEPLPLQRTVEGEPRQPLR